MGDPNHSVSAPRRSWVRTGIRSAISIALAVFLLHMTLRTTGTDLVAAISTSRMSLFGVALLLYAVVLALNAARWGVLLRVQGIRVPWPEVARLIMVGVFFNLTIPGGTGGDVIRMAAVSRAAGEGRRTEAVFSVVVDRIVGLVGLCLIAGFAVLLSLDALMGLGPEHAIVRLGAYFVGVLSVCGVVGAVVVEFHQALLKAPGIRHLVEWGDRVLPEAVTETVARLTAALDTYRRHRVGIAAAVGLSLAMHTLLAMTLFTIGKAVGDCAVAVREYFMTMEVANAVAAVPITPAGIGTRDMVISSFLQAFGAAPEHAGTTPLLFTAILIIGGLIGGLVFALVPSLARAERDEAVAP